MRAEGDLMSKPCIRLLLVDNHQIVRIGLATLFRTVPHFLVVGEAGTVEEAVAQARQCAPDVVLMDVRLPDGSGIEACRQIRSERPEARVLMLTSYSDEEAVIASIMAGAAGYLLKDTNAERLIEGIEAIARGGSLLDPAVTQTVLSLMQQPSTQVPGDPLSELSEREREILPLIAEGKTNREIALMLSLSENSVKSYVSNILQKLRLARRAEAAAFMARRGSQQQTET
ncbi:MAG TPA: response regulator transcription factor [Gammaproteobacteria bacterium]|nr:response regulator transcription factor [Gammaproteobacteria bacterium]